jgi:hypothetical protein
VEVAVVNRQTPSPRHLGFAAALDRQTTTFPVSRR